MAKHDGRWTETKEQKDRELAAKNYTAERISQGLSTYRTRAAIIGYCGRRGIVLNGDGRAALRPKKVPKQGVSDAREATFRPHKIAEVGQKDSLIPPSGPGIHLADAGDRSCRLIYGEPRNLIVCGSDAVRGGPYCSFHKKLCYLP